MEWKCVKGQWRPLSDVFYFFIFYFFFIFIFFLVEALLPNQPIKGSIFLKNIHFTIQKRFNKLIYGDNAIIKTKQALYRSTAPIHSCKDWPLQSKDRTRKTYRKRVRWPLTGMTNDPRMFEIREPKSSKHNHTHCIIWKEVLQAYVNSKIPDRIVHPQSDIRCTVTQ